ncbi:MAG TPA: DUF952 domain-containing protein [Bellilinea sp.]|nr:DUF952 domain-containing protein [Bellilinea sp.]
MIQDPPRFIYHIITDQAYKAALNLGEYRAESLANEGFIHFSTMEQVLGTAQRFYKEHNDLVLLEVDTDVVRSEIRIEESEPGNWFPHLYGPLNLDAITGSRQFTKDEAGEFVFPYPERNNP